MSSNYELKSILPPTGNLDFELVGHSARAGRMPVHSFKIRTTLESGERLDITYDVAAALDRKTNKDGALEGGIGYYKPDAIAGSLAEALYDQDRYKHTFKVRTEEGVSEEEQRKHKQVVGLRRAVQEPWLHHQVEDLLREGANPNAQNRIGQAPLHLVSNEKVAQQLLDAGADVRLKDAWGETPADVNPFSEAKRVIQTATNREALATIVTSSQDSDLASPEEALSRRSRGRAM